MKKQIIVLTVSILVLSLAGLKAINAKETPSDSEAKSVAWYVANIKEARSKNQQCHDDPSQKTSPDCTNALHALEITFKGGN